MHGALSTQKLELNAIQLRGSIGGNKRAVRVLFSIGCPGPGSSWGNLAILPASKERSEPKPHILFYSIL